VAHMEDLAEWIRIKLPKESDTFRHLQAYLALSSSPKLQVIDDDVTTQQTAAHESEGVSVVAGIYDLKRKPSENYIRAWSGTRLWGSTFMQVASALQ